MAVDNDKLAALKTGIDEVMAAADADESNLIVRILTGHLNQTVTVQALASLQARKAEEAKVASDRLANPLPTVSTNVNG